MAEIKGLVYNNDSVEFVTPSGGVIDGDLTINGDLTVEGTFNGEPSGGSSSLYAPMDVSNISAMVDGTTLNITWTDPDDTYDANGELLVSWAGTKVIYRTDRFATSIDDGILLIDSTERNVHQTEPVKIENIGDDTTYYIQFLPYSTDGNINSSSNNWTMGGNGIYKIVSFTDGTDEEISKMLNAHYRGLIDIADYWHVGDTRKIHLNAISSPNTGSYKNPWSTQDITIVITAINHHDLKEPINTRDKAAITVQTRECLNSITNSVSCEGSVYFDFYDGYQTLRPWATCWIKSWLNNQFYNTCLSNELKNLIKEVKNNRLSDALTSGWKVTQVVNEKVFLPSYPEIFGNVTNNYYLGNTKPANEEGIQWEYYKTSSNRTKHGNNNGISNRQNVYWWTSSATGHNLTWLYIGPGGSADGSLGGYSLGLAPAFCL